MKVWNSVSVYSRLCHLAQEPLDLRAPDTFAKDRIKKYKSTSAGFDLLYAMQRIDDEILGLLQTMADECGLVTQFRQMISGEIMNRVAVDDSENRQVLHTACRDIFTDKPWEKRASAQARAELKKLQIFLADLEQNKIVNATGERFEIMIHVGIGGSDLGPRAVAEALDFYRKKNRKIYFVSNVDPDEVSSVLAEVDLSKALVNIVSKSGCTQETMANEMRLRSAYKKEGLDPARHFIAVTTEGSPMDEQSKYLRSFYLYDYVGGRFSTTSMAGGVALGFLLGFEQFEQFLIGANKMDKAACETQIKDNIPLMMALLGIWNHNFLNHETVAILPYSRALDSFPAHLQQCDMESNGKSVNKDGEFVEFQTGPVVWGQTGTNGQHAFFQLLHQGTEKVPVEFIGFRFSQYGQDIEINKTSSHQKLLANIFAQSLAMALGKDSDNPNKNFQGNRQSLILLADQLTPENMGGLLALYEAKIAFQGFAWNINSFDQEGVQLGKMLAGEILQQVGNESSNEQKTLATELLDVARFSGASNL